MSGYITKINLGVLRDKLDERFASETIETSSKQSAIESFDYLLKKYTNIPVSYVLKISQILGDYGPDSLGYYVFSDYPDSGVNPSSLGFKNNPVMFRVRALSSGLFNSGDQIRFQITFMFSHLGGDDFSFDISLERISNDSYTIGAYIVFGRYYLTGGDDYFDTIPPVLDLTLLTPFFSFFYYTYDKFEIHSIVPSTLKISYYPPYSNTLLTDVFTNNKSLIHRNLSYSIRLQTEVIYTDDQAIGQPFFNRYDYDINFSGTSGSLNYTEPVKAVDYEGVSIDELIFTAVTRYPIYIQQDSEFYNITLPEPTYSSLPSYNSIDEFLPDFFDYLEFFVKCCNEKGVDEMDYTAQLESIANTLVNIDSRLHASADVEGVETDVNITQALIDNTESLDDIASRPIITTNEDLSPWSAV